LKSSVQSCHPLYGCERSWDRGKLWVPSYAVHYAITYAKKYNTEYRIFFNDCANFVSQALTEGGWQNDYGWYNSDTSWWYNSWYQSYTWAGASNLHKYIRHQMHLDNVVWEYFWWRNLRPGDVLALTLHHEKVTADHMMIVTGFADNEIYVSGHTYDRKNKPWSEVDPHDLYWGWGYHILYGNLR